ncbi:hypothetical protein VOLCADRAFT_107722 [Volvox carteri f. nagariensis]|uniref:Uncharacterized protein n=1 Tax=Volvox carteri f. nagariensis TaxID=3068 RepID=D8UFV9_VOLCA|nr:uncharacterized protein VOLCADRAFT_107722 [Volvox carteri f. nagariensis]EFJ41448.1 hypothetical protein VOLCADRAFT_107722 [Volvox carteri f. nagariensis]|eukprot:XP_002957554.1 hypothetical protein VOLCADRAFT_107722 [Volvox carteri f. nagariensis]
MATSGSCCCRLLRKEEAVFSLQPLAHLNIAALGCCVGDLPGELAARCLDGDLQVGQAAAAGRQDYELSALTSCEVVNCLREAPVPVERVMGYGLRQPDSYFFPKLARHGLIDFLDGTYHLVWIQEANNTLDKVRR